MSLLQCSFMKNLITGAYSLYKEFLSTLQLESCGFQSDKLKVPKYIELHVEERCFFRCLHCDIWKLKKTKNGLSLYDTKKLIEKLKSQLGNFQLVLSGGEPFLNRNTIPIIKYANSLGISTLTNSNGYLITDKKAKAIVNSGLNVILISVDSPQAKIHDFTRDKKGAHKKAVMAIKQLIKYKGSSDLEVGINTIIMEPNIDKLDKIVNFACELGVSSISFQPIFENFAKTNLSPKWYKKSKFFPKDEEVIIDSIDKIIAMKKAGFPVANSVHFLKRTKKYFLSYDNFIKRIPCHVGKTNITIDRLGDVRFCWFYESIGNIKNNDINTIWNSQKAKEVRSLIKTCKKGCRILLCNSPKTTQELIESLVHKIIK